MSDYAKALTVVFGLKVNVSEVDLDWSLAVTIDQGLPL